MIGGHPKAVNPAEFRCLVVTDQLAIHRKSAYNRVYVHYRGGASRGDPSRIRWGCLLSFRGSLRRFVTGGVEFPPVETELIDLESAVESFESTAVITGDGFIDRYARRAQARTAPHPDTFVPAIESSAGTPEHATAIAATAPTHNCSASVRPRRAGRQHSQRMPSVNASSPPVSRSHCVLPASRAPLTLSNATWSNRATPWRAWPPSSGSIPMRSPVRAGSPIHRTSPPATSSLSRTSGIAEEAAQDSHRQRGDQSLDDRCLRVVDGDTIESIATAYSVDPERSRDQWFPIWNDYIYAGQRLLIPGTGEEPSAPQSNESGPYLADGARVPAYQQARTLSCEYAAVYIATSALGYGIPESVFIESIGVTENPHYGFRGDIDVSWGGYDNYGVYPSRLSAS